MHEFTCDESYVFDYTYPALQAIDVGNGQRIPTFEELIKLVDKRLYINIEIKTPYSAEIKKGYI